LSFQGKETIPSEVCVDTRKS